MRKDYNPRTLHFWLLVVFLAAVVLRGVHYFGRSSMWLDELASAFNISERSFYQLATESLDFNQVAPLGFLWLQKTATLLFGVNDHAYRFFPFVLSLLSLVLFLSICKNFLKGLPLLGAFTLFALSIAMVFYGGESKQYSGDVTAALFLVWSSVQLAKGKLTPGALLGISVGGFLLIFCSMPAVVLAPFVLGMVFLQLVKKKTALPSRQFALVAASWAFACLLLSYYAKFVISTGTQEAMSDYWSRGFAPLTSVPDFLLWIPVKLHKELSFSLAWFATEEIPQLKYIAWSLLILSIPGILYLRKQFGMATVMLLAPVIVALTLAIFRVLPFDGRVSIYATWPFLVSGMAGIITLTQWVPKIVSPGIAAGLTLLVSLPIGLLLIGVPSLHPPYNSQSAQPVLRELKKQLQPDDIVYVYFKSNYAMRFYGPEEGITNYVAGRGYATADSILREIDSFKGRNRVWFFFTQWTRKQPFPDTIKAYMGTVIGKQIGYIPDPDGNTADIEAAAYLYDLSGRD